jgi:hypothetical protein
VCPTGMVKVLSTENYCGVQMWALRHFVRWDFLYKQAHTSPGIYQIEQVNFNLKIWKFECLNLDVWILKVENWKLKLKLSLWNVSKESKVLKIKMSKFGCVNTESWKLKIEIWNLFVKCLEGI